MCTVTIAEPRTDPMLTTPMVISARRQETDDTFTIDLAPPGGFTFRPGEFTMLYVYGVGEVPISISGDPAHPEVLTHTIRAAGKVTEALASA